MKLTIEDYDIKNKKVLIRCDFNVPLVNGKIDDDNRIRESLTTINYAIENGAKVILLSHLGRIKTEEDIKKNSLFPVSKRLSELLGKEVIFIGKTRGKELEDAISNMKSSEVLLIENTRFEDYPNKLESSNDADLASYWASLGDIFINDAFGTCHRSHASNVGIASKIPSAIGFLVEKELKMLGSKLNNPKRPYVVICGGAKMSDKIKVLDNLIEKADYVLLGGGIANTFLKALGFDMKKSIYDEDSIKYANDMLKKYQDKIVLPVDGYGSFEYKDSIDVFYNTIDNIKDDVMILDIGPETVKKFSKYIKEANTIFWNGPVGVSEFKNFEYGTKSLCEHLKNSNACVIIGGGDSASAAIRFGYKNDFDHISTGGGASLEFIEGKPLPGIEVIKDK